MPVWTFGLRQPTWFCAITGDDENLTVQPQPERERDQGSIWGKHRLGRGVGRAFKQRRAFSRRHVH